MSVAAHGGLSGKARRLHYCNRAHRLYARQLIDDYVDVSTDTGPAEHYIPIRGRSEFLPAIAQASLRMSRPGYVQLVLPLQGGTHDAPSADTHEPASVSPAVAAARSPSGKSADAPAVSKPLGNVSKDKVIRFARAAGADAVLPFKPPEQLDRPKRPPFTIGGFLAGCAMGSAAAAALLLVVRTVAG